MKTIIFPSSYFSDSKPDEELSAEYNAALETGLFDAVIFSYDKWFTDGILKLNKHPDKPIPDIYRGWMMKPEQYRRFYNELKKHNIRLITPPESYELFHIFPNIYPQLSEDTAKMLVFEDGEPISVSEIKKHFPKYFDETVTQEEFDKQMELFYRYRGELYTGGICIKEYLTLKDYGGKTNEYRVFYANGQIVSLSRNSGQFIHAPLPPAELIEKYKSLNSPYYTIDFAELSDGQWKILEAGDGQVSGLSDFQDHNAYFRGLYHCLE